MESYTKKELEELLALFQQEVQALRVGQDLGIYFANRKDANAPYRNLILADVSQEPHSILDPKAKLNLLTFWASWCGPCRQEIPALKLVYQTFHRKGLHMASISIDKDSRSWQKALGEEQVAWQQLVIPTDQVLRVRQQFNFRSIPLVILTDSLGNEITQKTGYSERDMAALQKAIAVGLQ
jgi:thiol-disulfide isomerase/thioredoxin